MRPLLDQNEQARLKKIIETFGGPGGHGTKLQLYLEDRKEKMDNWVRHYIISLLKCFK